MRLLADNPLRVKNRPRRLDYPLRAACAPLPQDNLLPLARGPSRWEFRSQMETVHWLWVLITRLMAHPAWLWATPASRATTLPLLWDSRPNPFTRGRLFGLIHRTWTL